MVATDMSKTTYHILGGGPAGLAVGYYLSKHENTKVNVYEARSIVGGMARSWVWDSFIVDTGPHILHTPLEEIWKDWKDLLGTNLIEQQYYSANYKQKNNKKYLFDYPINSNQLEYSDYWTEEETRRIKEDLETRPNKAGMASATNFKEYMYSLGGEVITNEFFNDYPEKVWGIKPEEMLPDWAPKRIRICEQQTPFFSDQYCGISAKGTGHLMDILKEEIHQHGGFVFTGKK